MVFVVVCYREEEHPVYSLCMGGKQAGSKGEKRNKQFVESLLHSSLLLLIIKGETCEHTAPAGKKVTVLFKIFELCRSGSKLFMDFLLLLYRVVGWKKKRETEDLLLHLLAQEGKERRDLRRRTVIGRKERKKRK